MHWEAGEAVEGITSDDLVIGLVGVVMGYSGKLTELNVGEELAASCVSTTLELGWITVEISTCEEVVRRKLVALSDGVVSWVVASTSVECSGVVVCRSVVYTVVAAGLVVGPVVISSAAVVTSAAYIYMVMQTNVTMLLLWL